MQVTMPYFVYYKNQEILDLFSNLAKLSVIPIIDKVLIINAIGLIEIIQGN
jgi:hypothetical protein